MPRAIDGANDADAFDSLATSAKDSISIDNTMPDLMACRGRGLAIMCAIVDQVQFTSEPELGTVVHLVKTLELDRTGPLQRLLDRPQKP